MDHEAGDLAVWESGAILVYLAEEKDAQRRLLPADPQQRVEVLSWLFFQVVRGLACLLSPVPSTYLPRPHIACAPSHEASI